MKPFIFKLQSALDLKLREEDVLKEDLHKATQIYKENHSRLDGLNNRLEEIFEILRGKQSREVNVQEVRNCSGYIPVLNDRIIQQQRIKEEARIEMEDIRSRLIAKVRERKVLEKLKARHYREYLQECLRQEQKEIDEMAITGYMHKDPAV